VATVGDVEDEDVMAEAEAMLTGRARGMAASGALTILTRAGSGLFNPAAVITLASLDADLTVAPDASLPPITVVAGKPEAAAAIAFLLQRNRIRILQMSSILMVGTE
jgi:hypothetical protein